MIKKNSGGISRCLCLRPQCALGYQPPSKAPPPLSRQVTPFQAILPPHYIDFFVNPPPPKISVNPQNIEV